MPAPLGPRTTQRCSSVTVQSRRSTIGRPRAGRSPRGSSGPRPRAHPTRAQRGRRAASWPTLLQVSAALMTTTAVWLGSWLRGAAGSDDLIEAMAPGRPGRAGRGQRPRRATRAAARPPARHPGVRVRTAPGCSCPAPGARSAGRPGTDGPPVPAVLLSRGDAGCRAAAPWGHRVALGRGRIARRSTAGAGGDAHATRRGTDAGRGGHGGRGSPRAPRPRQGGFAARSADVGGLAGSAPPRPGPPGGGPAGPAGSAARRPATSPWSRRVPR